MTGHRDVKARLVSQETVKKKSVGWNLRQSDRALDRSSPI